MMSCNFPHPGWSEQKPEDWYSQSMEGIKELISELVINPQVCWGSASEGRCMDLSVLDEDDDVIRPAILWNDGRTQERKQDYLK